MATKQLKPPKETPNSPDAPNPARPERSTTPDLTGAERARLATFLEKVFGEGDPDDNSSALIDLVKRENEVRARRRQAWVEEVEDEVFHGHSM